MYLGYSKFPPYFCYHTIVDIASYCCCCNLWYYYLQVIQWKVNTISYIILSYDQLCVGNNNIIMSKLFCSPQRHAMEVAHSTTVLADVVLAHMAGLKTVAVYARSGIP